ncbi:uncharacterized protein LOC109601561 [Aethina tumida]|uniref:uncharacterized protein LOC109601561 n=1 Tax=Aethina tumida TaxID=116153 RepID=UPI002149688E|nr:uncharacterized protein LOC109601561 [Aethina tumida]
MLSKILIIYALTVAVLVKPAPQTPFSTLPTRIRPYEEQSVPIPYDFNYKVDNPPTNTFFGQNEAGDQAGRVAGQYYVYLPDGRLMTVEYTVDGESGFVPRITFQNQAAAPATLVRG